MEPPDDCSHKEQSGLAYQMIMHPMNYNHMLHTKTFDGSTCNCLFYPAMEIGGSYPSGIYTPDVERFHVIINTCWSGNCHMHFDLFLTMQQLHSMFPSFRLRGGMDNPNTDEKSFDIPYLKDKGFFWDGMPCIDFMEVIVFPLENGLSTMSVKGYSLLDACNESDGGGNFGVPARAVAHPDVVAESIHRNKKAFGCIMNYIKRTSSFYRMAMREFQQDGIQILRAIRRYGTIPTPPQISQTREDVWNRMSMENLRIAMDQRGFFLWADIVYETGRKLNKTGTQQRDKFASGLPKWFAVFSGAMMHDNAAQLMHPQFWGGMFPGCPMAIVRHPLAFQPYVLAYAKKYFPDWCKLSLAARKDTFPAVRSIEDCSSVEDFVFLIDPKDVTDKMKCNLCDGDGHPSSIYLNGVKHQCLTRTITQHNAQHGAATSSSTHGSASRRDLSHSPQAKVIDELRDQIYELQQQLEQSLIAKVTDSPKRRFSKKPIVRLADDDSESEEVEQLEAEDSSASSDGSHISDMAQAVQPKKRFPKRR